ncbi:hypothetical protein [Fulvivirga sediminis]|uniref:Uncharacterized protein n=1 Tax=Fulvivirga sediminis TaxID=2803949 RepID=A0A937FAD3_9BACT|nr:hypothetical protein [Fulvivirga sediminis]MBL3657214.1 hypothetical protein [Fulvivirga sediminis]
MIPLKESIIPIESIQKQTAESNIRSRISKKHSLSLTNTASWVIFPDRLFVGKENDDGTVTVARYRNAIFKLFPKIYSKWQIDQQGEHVELKIKHRLSTFTVIGLWMFSVQYLVSGVLGKWLSPGIFISCILILTVGIYLITREMRINEQVLTKIAKEKFEN